VQQHVGIGMSEQTERVGDVDAADDELALRDQAVHIITVTDSHDSPLQKTRLTEKG
jgi:hypothetical protein